MLSSDRGSWGEAPFGKRRRKEKHADDRPWWNTNRRLYHRTGPRKYSSIANRQRSQGPIGKEREGNRVEEEDGAIVVIC